MGMVRDSVPMQLSKVFRKVQHDPNFRGWLKMQEAVMEIEFPYTDLPEVRDQMFTKDSLPVVEQKLLELYPDRRSTLATDSAVHTTMRYAYYIGETYRRAFDAVWVAIPHHIDPDLPPRGFAIDFPMREGMTDPLQQLQMAVTRRTGNEITRVYGYAERSYNEWIANGKPERTFIGTLREED